MTASRKFYVDLADTIKRFDELEAIPKYSTDPQLIRCIAMCLKRDNPRFKPDKFFRAAGFPDLADN